MGKKRSKTEGNNSVPAKQSKTDESNTNKAIDSDETSRKLIASALKSVKLPTSADGLTAEQLTSDQKMVIKKQCQNMYGHKFSTKRKLPASSIESATLQLAAKMKEKQKQLKSKKKKGDDTK